MTYEELNKNKNFMNNYKYLISGGTANIFVYEDNIVKLYKGYCEEYLKIKKNIFLSLKTINSESFVSLGEMIFRRGNASIRPDGYTMKRVEGENIDLIECSTEYILSMIERLDNLSKEITNRKIKINDSNPHNIIFTDNNVTIIDPDEYYHTIIPKVILSIVNKNEMIKYINKRLLLDKYLYHKDISRDPILDRKGIKANTCLADLYSKKLVKKKLIDNFK